MIDEEIIKNIILKIDEKYKDGDFSLLSWCDTITNIECIEFNDSKSYVEIHIDYMSSFNTDMYGNTSLTFSTIALNDEKLFTMELDCLVYRMKLECFINGYTSCFDECIKTISHEDIIEMVKNNKSLIIYLNKHHNFLYKLVGN